MSATLRQPVAVVPRVPMEYVGLARVFRSEVQLVDQQMERTLAAITAPLRARLKHHPKLRHEKVTGTERLYRISIPTEFRIGAVSVVKDRAAGAGGGVTHRGRGWVGEPRANLGAFL
jgi:hypothetical protein